MSNIRLPWWLGSIPPVTRNLIIINVLIWVIEFVTGRFGLTLVNVLGLHFWASDNFNPVQLLTYMFLHDPHSILHIGFNMFTLWMFGRPLEHVWGSRRFFIFYFVCGVGAAIVQECVWQLTWLNDFLDYASYNTNMDPGQLKELLATRPEMFASKMMLFKNSFLGVGASGAIFGILLGFAAVFPDTPMQIIFIPVSIKAKYMVIGYGVLEFFLGVSGVQSTVGHFAHLGGLLFGLILILWWKHKGTLHGGNRFYY